MFEIGLSFEVKPELNPGKLHNIKINPRCMNDPRFFSSKIVVAKAGTEGSANRTALDLRPEYYNVYGRHTESFTIRVPTYSDGLASNIRILAIPTPPYEFDTEMRTMFQHAFGGSETFGTAESERYPYRYMIRRLDETAAADASVATPIKLTGDAMLPLQQVRGDGFAYDCWDTSDGAVASCTTLSQTQCGAEAGRCQFNDMSGECSPRPCLSNRDCNGRGEVLDASMDAEASCRCNCTAGWGGPTCLSVVNSTNAGSTDPKDPVAVSGPVQVRVKGGGTPVAGVPFDPEVEYNGAWYVVVTPASVWMFEL